MWPERPYKLRDTTCVPCVYKRSTKSNTCMSCHEIMCLKIFVIVKPKEGLARQGRPLCKIRGTQIWQDTENPSIRGRSGGPPPENFRK